MQPAVGLMTWKSTQSRCSPGSALNVGVVSSLPATRSWAALAAQIGLAALTARARLLQPLWELFGDARGNAG